MADLLLAYQSLFAFVGINGLLALSVYTTLSCGQLSLANAGFMAIGAYTSAVITLRASGGPFIAALAASALLPAILPSPPRPAGCVRSGTRRPPCTRGLIHAVRAS